MPPGRRWSCRANRPSAVYLLKGAAEIVREMFSPGRPLVFRPGDRFSLRAEGSCPLLALGGEPMDGPRHIWRNFVASAKDRIEQAKADWPAGRRPETPRRRFSPPPGASRLFSAQFMNFHARILPAFLRCIDRASMAHGVEVRNPFLDWRLVTFGFALPDEGRIGGGTTKRILRLAMQGLMPESIRQRTNKFHFSSPVSEWARGALRTWLLDLSASRSFLDASLWDGPAARRAIEDAVAGTAEIGPVWPIVNAHVLHQSFKRAALAVPEPAAG